MRMLTMRFCSLNGTHSIISYASCYERAHSSQTFCNYSFQHLVIVVWTLRDCVVVMDVGVMDVGIFRLCGTKVMGVGLAMGVGLR